RSLEENGHPRACASFPRALSYFVREKKIVKLEEAIRKMTGLTADYLNVKHKGYIKEGYDADLVIFDFDNLRDTATYDNAVSMAEGIFSVIVGGETVYKDMQITGKFSGRAIRYKA
ncbi:MAG: D-aminoacylase, partial [Ruminococcaceae bacterium]|nr:D-aminoacylase [Oscillospiraceae bacterium]